MVISWLNEAIWVTNKSIKNIFDKIIKFHIKDSKSHRY